MSNHASPTAAEALARIAVLYRIEAEVHGRMAGKRHAARQERSRPVIAPHAEMFGPASTTRFTPAGLSCTRCGHSNRQTP